MSSSFENLLRHNDFRAPPGRARSVSLKPPPGGDAVAHIVGRCDAQLPHDTKMSSGKDAVTTKLGTSTTSLTRRSTATLQIV
jgi:hypothetical protein